MEIISRNYDGIEVLFDNSESLYINATKIAQQFFTPKGNPKDVSEWLNSKSTKEYITEFKKFTDTEKIGNGDLVVVRKGGNDKNAQGIWIHKKLIILFARWLSPKFAIWCDLQIEEILKEKVAPITSQKEKFELEIIGLKNAIEVLKVNEASKILMLSTLYKEHGLSTSYLPKYSDEQHTYSLSHLLKKYEVGISAKKLNLILISEGYLEIKTRKSTGSFIDEKTKEKKPKLRTFKSLTEKGLEFGKNVISPHNQLETQPHYFESKFQELLELISEESY